MAEEDTGRAVVGDVGFTTNELHALIGVFQQPGWRHVVEILQHDKTVTAECLLTEARERSLQDLGIAQGRYGSAVAMLSLPKEVSDALKDLKYIRKSEKDS